MRVLFVISILAASGLVWASLATAQHVRRTRRQRQISNETEDTGSHVDASASSPLREDRGQEVITASGPKSRTAGSSLPPPQPKGPRSLVQAWAAMNRLDSELASDAKHSPGPQADRSPAAESRS